jgi:imidazolonepropionase-like amidohydrolase
MNLRPLLIIALPVVALLKITGCADQTNPTGPNLPTDPSKEPGPGNREGGVGPDGLLAKSLCNVTKAGDAGKVIKATLLLPDAPTDGELFIDDKGTIACAAKDCSSTSGYDKAAAITCTNAVVSPGLINPHDHIGYANNPPHKPSAERYEHRHDWRRGRREHTTIEAKSTKDLEIVSAAELRFVMSGVTAGATAGGAPGLMRNLDGKPADLEAGLEMTIANSDTFPLDDVDGDKFPTECDGFTGPKRRKTDDIAKLKGYLPHIAEGIDVTAHKEFVCQSAGDATASSTYDLIQRQTAVIHGMAVNPADVASYRTDRAVLVWSPRSNVDLYGNTAPIALYDNMGVPIALGTDWLPSGSMNMSRELRCADELNSKYFDNKLTDKQLWQMVTSNAAFAVGAQHTLGMLKKGYVGDIAIFDATDKKNAYRAVIEAGVEDTVLVLRGGVALYGDTTLVADPGSGGGEECEDIPVCGIAKKACVKRDLKKTSLSDLEKKTKDIYPLFSCKGDIPPDEPSCVPSRGPTANQPKVSVYSAISGADKDGDGVPDLEDNCPSVFNPIRPMDDGKQTDTDGDGIGDACDKCPLVAGETCTRPISGDMDGDGVPNELDNCPEDANEDQTDADGDGKGAACDKDGAGNACDSKPNPGMEPCPAVFSIATLRRVNEPGHPKSGSTRAIVQGVWVTAVKTSGDKPLGFFIQEGTAQYSGMFVMTGDTPPTVVAGNMVDVEGDYEEAFGLSQLANPKIKVVDPGTEIPFAPVIVDAASTASTASGSAAGEPWETMLCRVNGPLTVSLQNADPPPKDFDEFAVTASLLRIDDNIYTDMGNDYPVGTTFTRITGICGFSFSNRKIWPRTAADIEQ